MNASVRRVGPADWETWRDVRLAALAEAPQAFASSLEKERGYEEADWRDWLHPSKGMKAVAFAEDAVGLIGAWVPDGRDGAVELYSMWVQPRWRGQGVGDQLVAEVLAWARENRHERIELWVVEGNPAAEKLYERHGFRTVDKYQPHPSQPELCERAMTLNLSG